MSKNHPNDNIYSILGKLEALKPTPEEKRFALVKEIRESVEAQGSILEGVDAVESRLAKQFAETKSVPDLPVDKKGIEKHYGGSVVKMGQAAKAAGFSDSRIKQTGEKFLQGKLKETDVEEKAPPGAKAERMVKGIKKSLSKDGHLSGKDKAIAYATTWKAHNKGQVEEGSQTCTECGMTEGECEHTMAEGETTHTGGEKVSTTKGTIHKSKATVDTEKLLSRGDVTDPDADDTPAPSAEKKGRGRPKMATKDRSQASMPWGGNPPKDTYKHQKGSFVHKIAESRLMDDHGQTLDHVLNRFRAEVRNFEQGGDLDDDLYHALFDYYNDAGEMPYGVAKARDGDPMEWVAQNLESHLRGGGVVGGNPDEDYGMEREGIEGNMPPVDNIPGKEDLLRGKGRSYYEEEVTMEDELNELARLAGIHTDEGNAFTGKLKDTPKGGNFDLDGKTFTDTSTLDEEPNEGNAFSGAVAKAKADGVQPGEKIQVGGKTYPVKESIEECGDSVPEGDFNINTSMSGNGDKSVTVTATGDHAAELLQMLRIAGLGGSSKAQELQPQMTQEPEVMVIDEPEEVVADEGAELANAPDPQYMSMRGSTMGPGEGDGGEKAMNPDRPTNNNGDNALATPPTRAQKTLVQVAALESKLAAEYESIKKISK